MAAVVAALAICAAVAHAEAAPVSYGPGRNQFFELYRGGPAAVLLLHENGETWRTIHGIGETMQAAGFTVLDVEWEDVPETSSSEIWGALTAQIEAAVGYAVAHASELGIDPRRVALFGGSRGANLSLLTAMDMNAAVPGTIDAVVSLSGDVNPIAQLERANAAVEEGEKPNLKVVRKFSRTYGCKRGLQRCPTEYLEEWSPYQKAIEPSGATAPPMLLAASTEEHYTASWEDQQPMAAALEQQGVPAVVLRPQSGHGFGYMGVVRGSVFSFLEEHDAEGG